MAQGLQLSQRLTQSLVLAPQLQQSLALLQAPTLELKALVEHEMEQNPVLEEVAVTDAELREKAGDDETPAAESAEDAAFETNADKGVNEPVDDFQAEFEKLVQLDQEWRDHFSQTNVPIRQSSEDEEKRQFMFDSLTVGTSLAEFLMEQVRETDLNEESRALAETIIGNIDDYGYLKATVDEIAASSGLPVEKISEVLKVIQSFDPSGVGARD
ncbi:MAG: RNA polymerase factor sigma-54, partial [Limisphaerales bacterium]